MLLRSVPVRSGFLIFSAVRVDSGLLRGILKALPQAVPQAQLAEQATGEEFPVPHATVRIDRSPVRGFVSG